MGQASPVHRRRFARLDEAGVLPGRYGLNDSFILLGAPGRWIRLGQGWSRSAVFMESNNETERGTLNFCIPMMGGKGCPRQF